MGKAALVPAYPSRVLGCLLGGAIGDAFGYEVEFERLAAIRKRFGPLGLLEPVRHGGRLIVSDDTQMTLFTLEGLNRARSAGCLADLDATLEHIRLATLDWYGTQSSDAAHARYTGPSVARVSCRRGARPATPASRPAPKAPPARLSVRSTTARAAAASCVSRRLD